MRESFRVGQELTNDGARAGGRASAITGRIRAQASNRGNLARCDTASCSRKRIIA